MALFFSGKRRMSDPVGLDKKPAKTGLIASLLQYELRARALRHRIFDDAAINDQAWHVLQDLFAAHLVGTAVRTKELCSTTGMSKTTLLRYLDHLADVGIIERGIDEDDHRATPVSLSETGVTWLQHYYSEMVARESELIECSEGLLPLVRESGNQHHD